MPTKRVAGPGKYAPGCRSDRARLGGTGLPEKGETKGPRQRSTGTSEAWVGWMTGGLDETGRRQSAPKWSASRVQAEAPTPPAPHPPVEKKALPVGWLVVTMMIFLGKMGRAGHEWREHAITGRAGGGGGGPGIGPHGNSYPLPPPSLCNPPSSPPPHEVVIAVLFLVDVRRLTFPRHHMAEIGRSKCRRSSVETGGDSRLLAAVERRDPSGGRWTGGWWRRRMAGDRGGPLAPQGSSEKASLLPDTHAPRISQKRYDRRGRTPPGGALELPVSEGEVRGRRRW